MLKPQDKGPPSALKTKLVALLCARSLTHLQCVITLGHGCWGGDQLPPALNVHE